MKSVFFVVLLCCQSAAVFAADKISLVPGLVRQSGA